MNQKIAKSLPRFLEVLGLDEEPMGIFYSDEKPADGFSPKPTPLPTREAEIKNKIDWQAVFTQFSCVIGNIWRARKKKTAAYFSAEQFGCVGGAFHLGFVNPMPETIIHYISTGFPNAMEGELYHDSPDNAKKIVQSIDPKPASNKFCVFKPLDSFEMNENPELVSFFVKPEILSGLHRLATFVTNDPEVVVSPSTAACGSLVVWPLNYLSRGLNKAVIGGMDPSARKYLKTDELTFTIPFSMFTDMINRFDETFLKTDTWATVQKKISLSKKVWRETS